MGTVKVVPEKTFWKDSLTYLGNYELGKDSYERFQRFFLAVKTIGVIL